MLKATKPAQAAGIVFSMPKDHVTSLMTEMAPADICAMLLAIPTERVVELLAAVPSGRLPLIMRQLSRRQFVDLLAAVPAETATEMLRDIPPNAAAELLSDAPTEAKSRLTELMTEHLRDPFSSALYQRQAQEAVVRAARRVSWLDQSTCDLLAEVFGKGVHVAVRHRPQPSFTGAEVDSAAMRADWRHIVGMVVLTNVRLSDTATGQAQDLRRSGRPTEVLRWIDERDDGAFKRALVRLAG